ncbi:clusterin-associated protein 1 [Uranotaenia lowii]|uniref:clusterin-associated protein 1 n=1 Tax=Uranotaenia lowii TaxID=190385 RepID=UPI002479BE14|nr:clusterin-associated protein 1 [Uranotaenia lowii]
MSFKDVRDLSEHLKLLGYPNNIPISVLNTPYGGPESFKAYSDILRWLVGRLEPNLTLAGGTRSEQDRILFVRCATEFLVTKSSIKLNPRKLYASSAAAAKELLKVTSLLIASPKVTGSEDETVNSHVEIDLSDKMDDLKKVRGLSSELTNRGAALYDLLKKELVNRETRTLQSNRPLELVHVEKVIKTAIGSLDGKLTNSKTTLASLKAENSNLSSKIQRKASELERSKQRLQALQKVRPAYLEEFEKLEIELKGLYEQYIIRIRCVDALKSALIIKNRTPTPTSPIAKMVDSSMTILPEGLMDSDDENDDDDVDDFDDREDVKLKTDKRVLRSELLNRDRGSTRFRTRSSHHVDQGSGPSAISGLDRVRMIGGMNDDLGPLDSSLGSSADSESDLEMGGNGLIDQLRSEDDDDEDEEEEDEADVLAKLTRENSTRNRSAKLHQDHQSDEDF